jgi:hypothetical protein
MWLADTRRDFESHGKARKTVIWSVLLEVAPDSKL